MKKLIFVFFFFVLVSEDLFSQDPDFRVWTSINLEKRINPKFSLLFTETVRFVENATKAGTIFSDFGIRYKLSKKWRISCHYRYSKFNNGDHTFSNGSRFYADLAYKQKTNISLTFTFRLRYQSQYTDMFTRDRGLTPQNRVRFKTTMLYELEKRYKPYVSVEYFYEFTNNVNKHQFVNSRYTAGIIYELNKRNSLDIYARLARGMNVKNPNRFYILGIELNHLF